MSTILWYQHPSNKKDGVISINKESITPPTSPEYVDNFRFLFRCQKDNEYDAAKTYIYKSPNGHNGYFIKGHLDETDVIGRKIAYMFYTDTTNKEEVLKQITDELNAHGFTCPNNLPKELKDTHLNEYIIWIIVGFVLLIALILIIKKL